MPWVCGRSFNSCHVYSDRDQFIIVSQAYRKCCVSEICIWVTEDSLRFSQCTNFSNPKESDQTWTSAWLALTRAVSAASSSAAKTYDIEPMQAGWRRERQVSVEINEDVSREMGIYSILLRNEIKIYTERRYAVGLMAAWNVVAII